MTAGEAADRRFYRQGTAVDEKEWTLVDLRPAKPRRKLKLSEALAWLATIGDAGVYHSEGAGWYVVKGDDRDVHPGFGSTPTRAIILARKAMGVK